MKMKKNYLAALGIFLAVIMATLVFQYKHFAFQTYHISSYHGFSYAANTDKMTVSDYFGVVSPYYGGAVVSVDSDEKTLQALVNLEDGSTLMHQLTRQEDGSYLMDVLTEENTRQKPLNITIQKNDGSVLASADLVSESGQLYQSSSYDYAFLNIFINQSGIFMGQFEAYDQAALVSKYDLVTIEFCHPDASKSSGYQLLARAQMSISDFLEKENLGYLAFLPNAHYDAKASVEVIITFESESRQAMIMTLQKEERA